MIFVTGARTGGSYLDVRSVSVHYNGRDYTITRSNGKFMINGVPLEIEPAVESAFSRYVKHYVRGLEKPLGVFEDQLAADIGPRLERCGKEEPTAHAPSDF